MLWIFYFLNSRCEFYANEWVDDLIASQFSMYFVYNILNIFSFLLLLKTWKSMSPYQNISEQTLFYIYSEWI